MENNQNVQAVSSGSGLRDLMEVSDKDSSNLSLSHDVAPMIVSNHLSQPLENHLSGNTGTFRLERNQNHSPSPNTGLRVVVVEDPAEYVRFRYASENLNPGIRGKNSTATKRTFPTIKIEGYQGPVIVVISCVTKDLPYHPHPHSLVGNHCKDGLYQHAENPDEKSMKISFPKLNIQCTLKTKAKEMLELRKKKKVDPFNSKFVHIERAEKLDMDAVRLCFQVFLPDTKVAFPPVVSQPVFNSKLFSSLKICKLSHSSASVEGGQEMMMFCDKINNADDIEIVFYEVTSNERTWESQAKFQPSDVHHGFGISFRTPAYKTKQVECAVSVFIQLRKQSTQTVGDPLPFLLFPAHGSKIETIGSYYQEKNIQSLSISSRQTHIGEGVHPIAQSFNLNASSNVAQPVNTDTSNHGTDFNVFDQYQQNRIPWGIVEKDNMKETNFMWSYGASNNFSPNSQCIRGPAEHQAFQLCAAHPSQQRQQPVIHATMVHNTVDEAVQLNLVQENLRQPPVNNSKTPTVPVPTSQHNMMHENLEESSMDVAAEPEFKISEDYQDCTQPGQAMTMHPPATSNQHLSKTAINIIGVSIERALGIDCGVGPIDFGSIDTADLTDEMDTLSGLLSDMCSVSEANIDERR